MPRLLLLRHAKSAWDDPSLDDHDRPLNKRGRRAADAMAGYLKTEHLKPDLVLCSTATRTRETWLRIATANGWTIAARHDRQLYHTGDEAMVGVLQRRSGHHETVMLVGHSPGIEATALRLIGDGDEKALKRLQSKYPTAALAEIRFDGPWSALAPGAGTLVRFVSPKALKD